MNVIWLILKILQSFNVALLACALICCVGILPHRRFIGVRMFIFVPYVILFSQSMTAILHLPALSGYLSVGEFQFSYIVIFLLLASGLYFCYFVKFRTVLFMSSLAYTLQHLSSQLKSLVSNLILSEIGFSAQQMTMKQEMVFNIIGVSICILVVFICRFLFRKRIKSETIEKLSAPFTLTFSVVSIFIVYLLSMAVTIFDFSNYATCIYASLICLFLLFVQFGVFEFKKVNDEKIVSENVLKKQKAINLDEEENIQRINKKVHDLKYQISAFRGMATAERNKSIEELQQVVTSYENKISTCCNALDVVLMEKNEVCLKNGIFFSCISSLSGLNAFSVADIYILFGNAMDNAIECELKIKDERKRNISLYGREDGNFIRIQLSNYCEKEVKFSNGFPVSDKNDSEDHGFGTRNMSEIVKKYGGTMVMKSEDYIFSVYMMFHLRKK